jgi:hypothetical protein
MKRIANRAIGLTLALGLAGIPAAALNQEQSNPQSASSAQSSAGESSSGKSSAGQSSSGQSLGDYARQIRKSPGTAAKPKVFDNDNLPRTDKLSIVGNAEPAEQPTAETEENAPAAESKPGGAETKTPGNPKAPVDEATKLEAAKQWQDKIDAQKQEIDLLSRELDVLQREYQLRAAAMYADAGNRLRNEADWDKQDAQYKQQIADKQKTLDDAKQKLDDMQEEARKAGMPESTQQQ